MGSLQPLQQRSRSTTTNNNNKHTSGGRNCGDGEDATDRQGSSEQQRQSGIVPVVEMEKSVNSFVEEEDEENDHGTSLEN